MTILFRCLCNSVVVYLGHFVSEPNVRLKNPILTWGESDAVAVEDVIWLKGWEGVIDFRMKQEPVLPGIVFIAN